VELGVTSTRLLVCKSDDLLIATSDSSAAGNGFLNAHSMEASAANLVLNWTYMKCFNAKRMCLFFNKLLISICPFVLSCLCIYFLFAAAAATAAASV